MNIASIFDSWVFFYKIEKSNLLYDKLYEKYERTKYKKHSKKNLIFYTKLGIERTIQIARGCNNEENKTRTINTFWYLRLHQSGAIKEYIIKRKLF